MQLRDYLVRLHTQCKISKSIPKLCSMGLSLCRYNFSSKQCIINEFFLEGEVNIVE